MARASISVVGQDRGLGYRGPGGNQVWACVGVASRAQTILNQEPVVVTSPADVESLIGQGPLRDALVVALTATGTSVVVFPLQRAAGGGPLGAGTAIIDGALSVTPLAPGWSYGGQHVLVQCTGGGLPGVATFRLVVDGVAGAEFTPSLADYGDDYELPATALAGSTLAEGVPTGETLQIDLHDTGAVSSTVEATPTPTTTAFTLADASAFSVGDVIDVGGQYAIIATISTNAITVSTALASAPSSGTTVRLSTAFSAGESAAFTMGEPAALATDIPTAVNAVSQHELVWRFCLLAGTVGTAVWSSFDSTLRTLASVGKYARGLLQLAGPTEETGAGTPTTVTAWVSGLIAGLTGAPTRNNNPRTAANVSWMNVTDPIRGRDRVLPGTYAIAAAMSARNTWEPPDATVHGPLVTDPRTLVRSINVKAMVPVLSLDQINAIDDVWYTSLCQYSGAAGIFITHVRLWGVYPQSGVDGSDFIGVERGMVMDEACQRVYDGLFGYLNSDVDTDAMGRMSEAARAQWTGRARAALQALLQARAITAADISVIDKDPGILQTSTVIVTLRIVPRGKAQAIEATITFAGGVVTAEEEDAA